jgi:dihydrofolate reductase
MRHFRERTKDHAVIMGRKTFDSIGRPLPRRLNIVLSRNPVPENSTLKWARNPETALLLADQYSIINLKKEFFVIGGENVYNIFDRYINVVYLTEVNTGRINGDAKFSREFDRREWRFFYEKDFPKSDIDDFSFRISCLIRRKPIHRYASRHDLDLRDPSSIEAWERYQIMVGSAESDAVLDESQLDMLSSL